MITLYSIFKDNKNRALLPGILYAVSENDQNICHFIRAQICNSVITARIFDRFYVKSQSQIQKKIKMKIVRLTFCFLIASMLVKSSVACTNLLVSKGASADGSTMISYLADAGGFMDPLYFQPAMKHGENDSLNIYEWDTGKFLGKIKQVPYTYKVIGNMNEHQLAIGETTFGGRKELEKSKGIIDYGSLMYITLQRAKTAREAIQVMTSLINEYGYASSGESFSIADKNEVWIMDLIGKGENEKGAVWVAAKVPDGYITAHANHSRIGKINFKDKANWMWSEDVISFARSKGFFTGRDDDFLFNEAYHPTEPSSLLLCEGRVWSIFSRAAPSQNFSDDYWRAVKGAEPYPLFIKPDKKIGVKDAFALMRDHFQGTKYDMTKGFAAGPHGNPYRWKPLFFHLPGDTVTKYGWERPISTQQTGFSFVTQSRSALPDNVGGLLWYGVDDTYSTCYMPLYMGMTEVPKSLSTGNISRFDWNSAFWVFNLVANYAYGMYAPIIKEIQQVQSDLETYAVAVQPAIEKAATELHATNPELASRFLTEYSVNTAEKTVQRWKELGYYLFAKYNDRYSRENDDARPKVKGCGYDAEFLKQAVQERPGYFKVDWTEKKNAD
ncbi:MAG: hypothetical protein DWQ44_08665 [Bacteroidetes bacterium]|nr:MAG: hypothetical protein DWQ33_02065 [Bacteroidota bacterium]REK06956.1 MAG: hypothetical protein DWQ39_02025 [Bacteroidota bacterium]REK33696.1 MAG: hypothetical protein DWQ44_08665 [Bacteroidota bacterium]REK47227.1 MAG: hypothetical protein DWQ48_13060 [Bacteroidota bacterium]